LLLKKRSWDLLIIGSVLEYNEKTEMELKILREKKVNGIITRAKAKWQVEGEKSTRYFCNLEKRHYLEKTIPNLILDNDIEASDQNVIQSELQLFYKKLYSSTEPIINKSHVKKLVKFHSKAINTR
jgi:hypothetical protein